MTPKTPPSGTERARDEQRKAGGPRYGGQPWQAADERGEQRFGHVRNDDANPSELVPASADLGDDDSPTDGDAAEAPGELVGSSEHAGMGRGDHPRTARPRARDQAEVSAAVAGPAPVDQDVLGKQP